MFYSVWQKSQQHYIRSIPLLLEKQERVHPKKNLREHFPCFLLRRVLPNDYLNKSHYIHV